MSDSTLPPIIFVFGPPGAGKGTHCRRLADDFNLGHLSVGDWARDLKDTQLSGAATIEHYRNLNKPIPGWELLPLLKLELETISAANKTWKAILLDGFPHTKDQMEAWAVMDMPNPTLVLHLHCSKSTASERFLARHDPRRPDDNVQLFHQRYQMYTSEAGWTVNLFGNNGKLVQFSTEGSNEGSSMEAQYAELDELLREVSDLEDVISRAKSMGEPKSPTNK